MKYRGDQVDPRKKKYTSYVQKARTMRPFTMNEEGSDPSTVRMSTETFDGENWVSFPTIFPKEGNTDSSDPQDWIIYDSPEEAFKEAQERGEVFDFGSDKESALMFGEGAWKPNEFKDMPRGRTKTYRAPFPFRKRFEEGGRSVNYVSNYIPDPLATGDVSTTTTSGTYTSDSKFFDGKDGEVTDPEGDLGEIQQALLDKFSRDRTGNSDTGYYDYNTDRTYRGSATGKKGDAYPNRIKTGFKQGYDYSPNIGIKNLQIKRSSNPFEALIQLKTKNILAPDPVQPKMVDPLYKIYDRKLNSQTGEYVYNTNKGEVRKQRGPEDAQFISQNRKAFDEMRKKYRR